MAASARTVPDPADATGFFTTVADKLLRSTFSFGITNIPVQSNGVVVYTPAVHRLLQVAANVRDAATTNFYPTVFRPVLYKDVQGNVFITGYQEVVSVTDFTDPQLSFPMELNALPLGASYTGNVYGVPWIIGAKKNLPSFNELYSFNTLQVTRKLQVTRLPQDVGKFYNGTTANDYRTNQMIIMGITNSFGFSLWNSYATNYPNGAANYPFAQPDLTVYAVDFSHVLVSNGLGAAYVNNVYQLFASHFTVWPGSQWNLTLMPNGRYANANSFIYGATNFTILPADSMLFDAGGNFTGYDASGPRYFSLPISVTPKFPQITVVVTNLFQAYILDHGHVIDYVQFAGPSGSTTIADILRDPDGPYDANNRAYMWSTNAAVSGVNWGVRNQIDVSKTDLHVPSAGTWTTPNPMPAGVPALPLQEAKSFGGFFSATWSDGIHTYTNTALTNQAPYTPIRTIRLPATWVVNDPLVHYLASDLALFNAYVNNNGVAIYDDPANPTVAIPPLASVMDRYQPWGRNAYINGLNDVYNVIQDDIPSDDYHASYDLAWKDPLVYSSDNWDFPATNSLPLTTLGRVHRGTPWQTIYLKATNLLEYVAPDNSNTIQTYGQNTWKYWTGDLDTNDAALMKPVRDRRLAVLLTEMFNTNDATQLASINGTAADWSNLLDGVVVQTNTTGYPHWDYTPEFDTVLMTSNSDAAGIMASGLMQMKANQSAGRFVSVGDILGAPEISEISPWLNRSDVNEMNDQIDYTLSDEAYEAVPAQLLSRLRPDSMGGIVSTNGSWSVQFSGGDGFEYAVQCSTNLIDWTTIGTNQPVGGVINLPVAPAGDGQKRFYRSVLLP